MRCSKPAQCDDDMIWVQSQVGAWGEPSFSISAIAEATEPNPLIVSAARVAILALSLAVSRSTTGVGTGQQFMALRREITRSRGLVGLMAGFDVSGVFMV